MSKTPAPDTDRNKYAWLVHPAKDLVENFSIDVLKALSGYLEQIQRESDAQEGVQDATAGAVFQFFDFQQACRILTGSAGVYAKKVDHVLELTLSVMDLMENKEPGSAENGGKRGRGARRVVNLGSTNYDLVDIWAIKREALQNYDKAVKEEKKAIDALRMVDNAEIQEAQYERKSCLIEKPTQFLFKLDYGQLMRTDEQIQNAKSRADVIGKVKDFYVKTSEIVYDHETLISHDDYAKNVGEFTLPGARWIPDNKELAANFGVADVEIELDEEQGKEQINAYGPYTDPLSGREVVAPPRWFVEQEATRQHLEIQSRATSRASKAAMRDSQGTQNTQRYSQRQSQPLIERHRNNLNEFVSFVEGRMNKNRPSTHLNTGLIDMFVDQFGDEMGGASEPMGGARDQNYDFDDDFGGDFGEGGDEDSNDYVRNLTRRNVRKEAAPWDDLEKIKIPLYTGDEDLPVSRKPVKAVFKTQPTPSELLRRKQLRQSKIQKSRRDEFMETHDYLQDFYYWRSAARINPNKDWKIEALRSSILTEKKRRIREKTQKIREIRAQRFQAIRRKPRGVPVEEFEGIQLGGGPDEMVLENDGNPEEHVVGNRRTMGVEFDDVVDEDLAAEVELDEFGGGGYDMDMDYDGQVDPQHQIANPATAPMPDYDFEAPSMGGDTVAAAAAAAAPTKPLLFEDIDDAELNTVINLPGSLFINKALPLLKKFAEHKTDRDQMAYEMAKAYEDVDVAVSCLQDQVDKWHQKMEPILDEGETRKEYDVHLVGRNVLANYDQAGETKRLIDLILGRPWFEISRYFLACLFMCNMGNVMVDEDRELPLEERINTMKITLIHKNMHSDQIAKLSAPDE
ncbi:hypothetical protein L3Y34_002484 [Caenorhabditis briggsae]|nr:hypothetical protein L3Y34_002484 [Caenorhabditis briggsae]